MGHLASHKSEHEVIDGAKQSLCSPFVYDNVGHRSAGRVNFSETYPTATELDFADPVSGRVYKPVFTGTGEQATAVLTPSSLNFGSQIVGSVGSTQIAFLQNVGTGPLHVSNANIVGPFKLNNSCPTVSAGTPCQMQIAFAPTRVGPQTGALTVTADGSTPTQTIALTGTGVPAPSMTFSPTSLSFAAQLAGTRSEPRQ